MFRPFSLPLGVEGWLRFVTVAYSGPFYLTFWVQIRTTFRPNLLSHCVLVSGHLDPLIFPLSFFKESKALLASTIIFFKDTSCYL